MHYSQLSDNFNQNFDGELKHLRVYDKIRKK